MKQNKRLTCEELKGFVCRGCGDCCRGEGFVSVTLEEMRRMSALLNISEEEFLEHYAFRSAFGDYWLKEQENRDCIFLRNNRCLVHEAKPAQCRNFPYTWSNEDSSTVCPALKQLKSCR